MNEKLVIDSAHNASYSILILYVDEVTVSSLVNAKRQIE